MAAPDSTLDSLIEFVAAHRQLFVLTGAGCSTASGIPDYRDAEGEWKRGNPVTLQDFVASEHARRRYWARSLVGWKRIRSARPNAAHRALAGLENHGRLRQLVTQNVDGLHQAAGTRGVIDLHGRLDVVRCLACEARTPRENLQTQLLQRNPAFATLDALSAPDGDADLEQVDFTRFDVPDCSRCGGMLKPDVVFFGESVPRDRVSDAMAALETADAMLVVGSSLMVYSGFRFVRAMAETGKPVAAINLGRTRADDLLALKIEASCEEVLQTLLAALRGASARVELV